jgi:hypothetical protein
LLETKDLKNVALVNHRFRSFLESSLFNRLLIDEHGVQELLENPKHKDVTYYTHTLTIRSTTYNLFAPGSILADLATKCKSGGFYQQLTPTVEGDKDKIWKSRCTLTDMSEPEARTAEILPAIRTLHISVEVKEKPGDLASVMGKFPNLTKLTINANSLQLPPEEVWPSLEQLIFDQIPSMEEKVALDQNHLKSWIEEHKKLRSIFAELFEVYDISQDGSFSQELHQVLSRVSTPEVVDNIMTQASTELETYERLSERLRCIHPHLDRILDKTIAKKAKAEIFRFCSQRSLEFAKGRREALFPYGPDVTLVYRPMPVLECALQGAKDEIRNCSERASGFGDEGEFFQLLQDVVGGRILRIKLLSDNISP